ncbi:MAG: hypothetical protein LBI64_07405 [Coriobacteriales bacterium]|jgi:hypothetical protein|nr:hypothetical protein [Coriobacteriales bacterium]
MMHNREVIAKGMTLRLAIMISNAPSGQTKAMLRIPREDKVPGANLVISPTTTRARNATMVVARIVLAVILFFMALFLRS